MELGSSSALNLLSTILMKRPEAFEFYRPASLQEASRILKDKGPGGRFLAGGTDLVIAMKEKGLVPKYVVDFKRLPDLSGIREEGDGGSVSAR